METEFINVYIERQKNVITDFQSKVILLETNMQFKEQAIEVLNNKTAELTAEVENLQKTVAAESDLVEFLKKSLVNFEHKYEDNEISYKSRINDLLEEIESLNGVITSLKATPSRKR
jgi:predicted  nucleic acid-binding Zn-ribbon protein